MPRTGRIQAVVATRSLNLDKDSAVLDLVQDKPALCADVASGILDKICARRFAGGRSAPKNGPRDLTKECYFGSGSGQVTSEVTILRILRQQAVSC